MKRKKVGAMILAVLVFCDSQTGVAQGTFVNLDFESPILPLDPNDPFGVPITNALPGWTGYIGANQTSRIFYNTIAIGSSAISIHDSTSLWPAIQGSYSVLFQIGIDPSDGSRPVPALAQTGIIPASAQSVRFLTGQAIGGIALSFEGNQLGHVLLQNLGGNVYLWGADITSYAGQTGELRFFGAGSLDSIHFSPEAIPEPGAVSLLAFGVLLLGWRLRRK